MAILAIPILLFLCIKNQNTIYLLISVFLIGYVISEIVKIKKHYNTPDINEAVVLIITILIPAIFTFVPFNNPPIKEQLNRLYFPKDSINFENEIICGTSNGNFLKLIFAFDNSAEGLTETINKRLQSQFENYCNEIERFPSWVDNEKKELQDFRKRNTYGNFLKARLCFDLIKQKNDTNEFIVLKIGNTTDNRYYKNEYNDFKPLENSEIRKTIMDIIKTTNNEEYTDFNTFYIKLENIISHDKINEQAVLFTYSDFYHDCKGVTEDDIKKIKEKKSEIIQDIVSNCFIDNHNRGKARGGNYILNDKPDFRNEAFFYLDSIDEDDQVSIGRVLKNKHWFYSQKKDGDINTKFSIVFPIYEKYIRSYNTNNTTEKDYKRFSISDVICENNGKPIYFGKNVTVITLKYEGIKVPNEETLFEIIHDDIHYFVYFEFIEEWNKNWKWGIPILTLIFGCSIGMFKIKKHET